MAAASRPSSSLQHRPRCARRPTGTRGLGPFGHLRQLHRVAGHEHRRRSTPSVRSISTSMLRPRGADRRRPRPRSAPAPTAMPAADSFGSRFAASSCATAHASIAGRMHVVEVLGPARSRSANRGSVFHSGWPSSSASARTGARARSASRTSRRTRWNGVEDRRSCGSLSRCSPERLEVGDDVGHRDGGVVHRDVDALALAGRVAVAQRGEHADRRRTAPELMSPSAPTGFGRGVSSGRRACSRRCPTSPRRSTRTPASRAYGDPRRHRSPTPTRRSPPGATAAIPRRSRGPGGRSCPP